MKFMMNSHPLLIEYRAKNSVTHVGPFCRKGLSPQGEPVWRAISNASRLWRI